MRSFLGRAHASLVARPIGLLLAALFLAALLGVAAVLPGAVAAGAGRATPPSGLARVKIYVPRGALGKRCDRVVPLVRTVHSPAVLTGAMRELLRGPTRAERVRGYGGWFSAKTAGMLRRVTIVQGVARIDFRNFSRVIPNASSSCGSALLLAQLDRTAAQFRSVRRAVYSFDGSVSAFYEWLQLRPPP